MIDFEASGAGWALVKLLGPTGGDSYIFGQSLPAIVASPSITDGGGFVLDSRAIGTFYVSPVRFEVFEEEAGQTNTSTARLEAHGAFAVERALAGCYLEEASA